MKKTNASPEQLKRVERLRKKLDTQILALEELIDTVTKETKMTKVDKKFLDDILWSLYDARLCCESFPETPEAIRQKSAESTQNIIESILRFVASEPAKEIISESSKKIISGLVEVAAEIKKNL